LRVLLENRAALAGRAVAPPQGGAIASKTKTEIEPLIFRAAPSGSDIGNLFHRE
jgi:hypothetical protein